MPCRCGRASAARRRTCLPAAGRGRLRSCPGFYRTSGGGCGAAGGVNCCGAATSGRASADRDRGDQPVAHLRMVSMTFGSRWSSSNARRILLIAVVSASSPTTMSDHRLQQFFATERLAGVPRQVAEQAVAFGSSRRSSALRTRQWRSSRASSPRSRGWAEFSMVLRRSPHRQRPL